MHSRFIVAWTLSIAAAAPLAWAQSAPAGAKPDPQDAQASVPGVIYRSSLADYRVLPDEEVGSWKETNDKVGRIGGWRAYAKEAQQAEPATDKPAAAGGAKATHGRHGSHKMN